MEEEIEECEASSETQESGGCGEKNRSSKRRRKKKSKKSGKRFSNEQVRSLESIFRLETKLETKKKVQVATDLGLQPRQVAIWFQNKRARWKSKQMEHEFRVLKSEFDSLNAQFDKLKREKEYLLLQLEELRNQLERSGSAGQRKNHQDTQSRERPTDSENRNAGLGACETPIVCVNGGRRASNNGFVERDIEEEKEEEEVEFLNLVELGGSPFASPDHWCSGSLNSPFDDDSCGPSK
ncbi:hypothetical protein DM860_012999 [Cuscuta australis]|uniref:Homeobox-leucine zipper protein n=1 Tax=Cuscuta australis TaxID=267555 RepID=A0A328D5T9_9ASTE|nr:hypothetical protein DM860_012999 [Cuscuta australis]